MKSMVMVWTCNDDQAPGLGKEERGKIKWAQGKGDIYKAILSVHVQTLLTFELKQRQGEGVKSMPRSDR